MLVLEATGVPLDTQPASVLTGLEASAIASSQITVSWSPSTDDVGVAGYGSSGTGSRLDDGGDVVLPDTGLTPLTSYSYTVAAFAGQDP